MKRTTLLIVVASLLAWVVVAATIGPFLSTQAEIEFVVGLALISLLTAAIPVGLVAGGYWLLRRRRLPYMSLVSWSAVAVVTAVNALPFLSERELIVDFRGITNQSTCNAAIESETQRGSVVRESFLDTELDATWHVLDGGAEVGIQEISVLCRADYLFSVSYTQQFDSQSQLQEVTGQLYDHLASEYGGRQPREINDQWGVRRVWRWCFLEESDRAERYFRQQYLMGSDSAEVYLWSVREAGDDPVYRVLWGLDWVTVEC